MYTRALESLIKKESSQYPVQAIVGPRQSGKTTLARKLFSGYEYISLEEPDIAEIAKLDPRAFFKRFEGSLILDEVQKTPHLLSYIQSIVDEPNNQRKFVLTGSEHLLLSEKISQSLAGRVRTYSLLPLSLAELKSDDLLERLLKGSYPRIYDQSLDAPTWLSQYTMTYLERDVRNILNVNNLDLFDKVLRLCASRAGQLMDFSGIANDAGTSAPTVRSWISVLKSTFICFQLEPHFKNFNKRLIKSPKLYFFDTGLLCYLLRIKNQKELQAHPNFGAIFENWVISEYMKNCYNQGQLPDLYFWRDQKGREVDLIVDQAGKLFPIEIKAASTFYPDFIRNLNYLNSLQDEHSGRVVYAGDESFAFKNVEIKSWKDI